MFYFRVDSWPLYASAWNTFNAYNSDVSVMQKVKHGKPQCQKYDYSKSPEQNIVFNSDLSARRRHKRSALNGNLSRQFLWTKSRSFERMGLLRVAILHCLESIGVVSIKATCTVSAFNNFPRVDSVLDWNKRERAWAL